MVVYFWTEDDGWPHEPVLRRDLPQAPRAGDMILLPGRTEYALVTRVHWDLEQGVVNVCFR